MPLHLGIRTVAFLALTGAFAALALPAASAVSKKGSTTVTACAHARTGNLRLKLKPRKCRKSERPVTWGIVGPRGAQGAQGPQGPKGDAGPLRSDRPAIFSAQANGYVSALSPEFAAVGGVTQVSSTEPQVQMLSPAGDFTATNLSVRATAAPGAGNSMTVTLRANGTDTAVACTISSAATTCTSAGSALVGAGSAIALKISSSPAATTTALLIGFEGR
jgi:hypothetical protein